MSGRTDGRIPSGFSFTHSPTHSFPKSLIHSFPDSLIHQMHTFFYYDFPTTPEPAGEGISREILAYGPSLMLVRVTFEKGAVGAPHHHPHAQITYVESGVFRCRVGERELVLKAGEGFHAAPDVEHGVVCEQAGVLLDSFSPLRADFL